MNKKAASLLVGIIIGLILLLVVSTVYYTFFQKVSVSTKGAVVNSACKASLDLTAARIKGPFKTTLMEFGTQPKCEVYDVLITQKDINLVSGETGENDENAIKRIIAEIMTKGIVVTTLDNKGNPERKPVGGLFATVSRGQEQFFEDSAGRFCMPWATISFEEDVIKNTPEIRNFLNYLIKTPMNFKETPGKAESPITYHSYLNNKQESLEPTNIDIKGVQDIKDKDGKNIELLNRLDGSISGENGLANAGRLDFFKTSNKFGVFYVQDVSSNWALIGAAVGIGVGVILIPFTAGLSGVAVLGSTAVLIPAAVGSGIGGYALGEYAVEEGLGTGAGIAGYAISNYLKDKGYGYTVTLREYTRESVEGLGCDYLK